MDTLANRAELYSAIENRYQFLMPEDYRAMEERGWLDSSVLMTKPFNLVNAVEETGILYLHDIEWFSLQEIAEFEFEDFQYDRFVPFAKTGGGDYLAFDPQRQKTKQAFVVELPRDCEIGSVHSPTFTACIYIEIISFCTGIYPQSIQSLSDAEKDARRCLSHWRRIMAEFFPRHWLVRLRELEVSPLISLHTHGMLLDFAKYHRIIAEDAGMFSKEEVRWMKPN